ncbi:hypothetical protein Efla_001560 [Eimeria flavescens]
MQGCLSVPDRSRDSSGGIGFFCVFVLIGSFCLLPARVLCPPSSSLPTQLPVASAPSFHTSSHQQQQQQQQDQQQQQQQPAGARGAHRDSQRSSSEVLLLSVCRVISPPPLFPLVPSAPRPIAGERLVNGPQ